jgi:tetratricopeptide (TPR) repeat protein
LNTVASKYFDAIVRQLTYTYWYANQLNEGIIYLDSCISKETELPNHLHRVYFANIAFLYNMGVDFSKAEFYLLKAAEISNKYNDLDQIYMDQSYLGALYSNIGKFEKAILHYEKALKIAKNSNDDNKISYIIQNLGHCYDSNGNLQKGVEMIFDGISRAIEKKDNLAIAKAYQQLGRLMIRWHNYKDADKYLHTSLKINKKENHKFHIVNDYINLVVSKIHQSSKDSVDYYLNIFTSVPLKLGRY